MTESESEAHVMSDPDRPRGEDNRGGNLLPTFEGRSEVARQLPCLTRLSSSGDFVLLWAPTPVSPEISRRMRVERHSIKCFHCNRVNYPFPSIVCIGGVWLYTKTGDTFEAVRDMYLPVSTQVRNYSNSEVRQIRNLLRRVEEGTHSLSPRAGPFVIYD